MFRIDVELDELTLDGLDLLASAFFDGLKGKFTTDWAITGPLIEHLGVELSYTQPTDEPDSAMADLRERLGDDEPSWAASYEGQFEMHAKPLVAVIKVLLKSKIGDSSMPIAAENVVNYVRKEYTVISAVLEESDCHEVTQMQDDINSYLLTPKDGQKDDFQGLVRCVKQLSRLQILSENAQPDTGPGVDALIVKHIGGIS